MTCDAFWDAGVAEVFAVIEAAAQRIKMEFRALDKIGLSAAWHTESFARQKRLPALKGLFEEYDRTVKAADAGREPADQATIDDWVAARRKSIESLPR